MIDGLLSSWTFSLVYHDKTNKFVALLAAQVDKKRLDLHPETFLVGITFEAAKFI